LIAKVIVHAPTRREAASRLARVLETTEIQGLKTNRDFLVTTLRTPEYLAGDTTTDFIERVKPALTREVSRQELVEAAIATTIEGQARRRASAKVLGTMSSGWRNSTMPMERISYKFGKKEEVEVAYKRQRNGQFVAIVDEQTIHVTCYASGEGNVDLDMDGRRLHFGVSPHADDWLIHSNNGDLRLTELPRYPSTASDESGGGLTAPMPGSVLATQVAAGAKVAKGDLLVILEAMKMEHRITAPRDGVVESMHVNVGEQVENAQLLVTLAATEGE